MSQFWYTVGLLVLLSSQVVLSSRRIDKDRLPGWEGETFDRYRPFKPEQVWVETLSMEPRAFMYHNLLTFEECDYLVNLARPYMEKSQVVDSATGKFISGGNVRTSSGHFLTRGQDEVVQRIEERIAYFTNIPASNGEPLHVLHYGYTEKYDAHYDYFHDTVNTVNGGQRQATMLMYLSEVDEGGETVFPLSTDKPVGPSYSECARQGLHVKPKKGDALLFYSMKPDGTQDMTSLHGGCPVIKGDKWSATKWMRQTYYALPGQA